MTARMNGIAGQATTDTEILDARTDEEGTTHANLGEHIRKAEGDIQNILDYGEALVSVPDEIRQKNLVEMMDASTTGTDGTTIIRSEAIGKADKASVVVNGVLGDDYGRTIFHISKPIHFEAGETYTILADIPTKDYASGSIFFYHTTNGSVLQQNGSNRGFTLSALGYAKLVPDTTGDYRVGLYCHGYEYEDYVIRLYILKGEYDQNDILSYVPYSDLRNALSRTTFFTDYARENNLIRMRSSLAANNAGEVIVTVKAPSGLEPALAIVDGTMGPAFSVARISEEFTPEAGETYTLFVDDGGSGLYYNIMISD